MTLKKYSAFAVLIATVLAIAPAFAAPPPWAGGGKGDRDEQKGKRENQKGERDEGERRSSRDPAGPIVRHGEYFGDPHRVIVRDYYREQFRGDRCPPGLAKKRNGCMPPGQAKKWFVGRPLPRDVVLYEVPQQLVVRIGQPPPGYRYVRVAGDILLIAIGTSIVVDAIRDLGGR